MNILVSISWTIPKLLTFTRFYLTDVLKFYQVCNVAEKYERLQES